MKACLSCLFLLFAFRPCMAQDINGKLLSGGIQREYILHLPAGYDQQNKIPLLMIFHGGGGTDKQMQGHMKMDPIADREQFITVYPKGLNKQWNDGREFKEAIAANDDVQFIRQLLDSLQKNYTIDSNRIFATGISNGGFFSIYLAYKLSNKLLAVAPVCASIPERIFDEFEPGRPVSIMLMNGTSDPLVPYNGGDVGNKLIGSRGKCSATTATIDKFKTVNKCDNEAVTENLPDNNNKDGCTAIKYSYTSSTNNSKVVLVKILGGGHTLPGASQYLPKFIIGKVCNDFEGNEMIWSFFKNCR